MIASIDPGPAVVACLEALDAQRTVEVVVVNASGDATAASVRQRFPHVQVIETFASVASIDPTQKRDVLLLGIQEAEAPLYSRLTIVAAAIVHGVEHPHEAQNPKEVKF